ncbi:hypothetical protein D3C87_405790 [compost metagenome]
MENNRSPRGGRRPKLHPRTHRYVFRLDDTDNEKFLRDFEASGLDSRARYITHVLFSREIRTVRIDAEANDFHVRLTSLFGQFRAVGTNYNQVVKILYRNFSQKKAAAYLYKLEQQTAQLAQLCTDVIALTESFKQEYLEKRGEP